MKKHSHPFVADRRKFIKGISVVLGTAGMGLSPLSLFSCQADATNNQSQGSGAEAPAEQAKKLGIALVGLGNYSNGQLAPALQQTKNCYLAGVVTGTPAKAKEWQQRYNIPEKNVYDYKSFDRIADNKDIDIVYVVLPNSMHAEYSIRAAQAGKHVICEKPMATSVEDCQRMIDACKKNGVKLSIGYRLHFEPHNQRVMELGQKQLYGAVKKVESANSFVMGNWVKNPEGVWRLNKELSGGGPLQDMGIYCIQGAIYTMGQEPVAVRAKFGEVTRPDLFKEVEQSISWQMEFPNGVVASCNTSYNDQESRLSGEAEKGWWRLDPAYNYNGLKGTTSEGPMNFGEVNEQALQMDDFAACVRDKKETRVPGEMGLRDVRIIEAIYEAARSGQRVSLA